MDDFHRRLAEIGLEAAAEHGLALAGGYAVQAHGIVRRPSEDVDLFTSAVRVFAQMLTTLDIYPDAELTAPHHGRWRDVVLIERRSRS